MAAERKESPYCVHSNKWTGKFAYPVSFLSLLICITFVVRVEIINQRVNAIEDFMAKAKQASNMAEVTSDVIGMENPERVDLDGEFHSKDREKERGDTSEGKHIMILEHR